VRQFVEVLEQVAQFELQRAQVNEVSANWSEGQPPQVVVPWIRFPVEQLRQEVAPDPLQVPQGAVQVTQAGFELPSTPP
jgi:hypothetical protein